MKRFSIALAFAVLCIASSCTKDEIDGGIAPVTGEMTGSGEVSQVSAVFRFDAGALGLPAECQNELERVAEELEKKDTEGLLQASGSLWTAVHSMKFTYWSVDGSGKPIELSARLYWPYSKITSKPERVNDVVVYCHETMFQSGGIAPSETDNNNFGTNLAQRGNLVVIPDYIGFGETKQLDQTYLCQNLIARNCVDALLAAIGKSKTVNSGISSLKEGYGTYIMGYSQGGGNGLALHRYIETKASDYDRRTINLKRSFLGSGPYNPLLTFQSWMEDGQMTMPILMAMVLQGFQAEGKSKLAGYDLHTYFSEAFNSSGLLDSLAGKTLSMAGSLTGLINYLPEDKVISLPEKSMLPYYKLDAIASNEVFDPQSELRKILDSCLEEENQLAGNWKPQHPITFFYTEGDDIVPAVNTVKAFETLDDGKGTVKIVNCGYNSHILAQIVYMVYAIYLDAYKSDSYIGNIPQSIIDFVNGLLESIDITKLLNM